jgi:hypothetical protein
MRHRQWLLITVLLLTFCRAAHGQTPTSNSETPTTPPVGLLRNNDVLRMVGDGVKSEVITSKILTSHCNFDLFPPVLRDLKRRGVPDIVLMAMKLAPNGPASANTISETSPAPRRVRIPTDTAVEVEAAYPVSSANVHKGDLLTFQVTRQVFVNNVLVIDREAVAKARVVSARPAGRWGRAGMLAWAMEYVVAVDGTRLPLQISGRIKGNSRSFAVAGGVVATGALIFPYTSPVGLIWGLKKGDEAILRGSKPFVAVVSAEREVTSLAPQRNRLIFHDMDTVKASITPSAPAQLERLAVRH